MFYILAVDLETTGLDHGYNEIIQIGAQLLDNNLTELGRFESLVSPDWPERAVRDGFDAFEYTGISKKEVAEAPSCSDVLVSLEQFIFGIMHRDYPTEHLSRASLRNVILFGQNVRFDASFLESEYKRVGRAFPFDFHVLSLESLFFGYSKLVSRKQFESVRELSLNAIARSMGIVNENPHDAMSDISTTVDCLRYILAVEEK